MFSCFRRNSRVAGGHAPDLNDSLRILSRSAAALVCLDMDPLVESAEIAVPGAHQRREFLTPFDLLAPALDHGWNRAGRVRLRANLVEVAVGVVVGERWREWRGQKNLRLLVDDELADIRRPALGLACGRARLLAMGE